MKSDQSVAIVGIGGVFPMAPSLDRFWSNIVDKVYCGREVPEGRWLLDPKVAYHPEVAKADHVYSKTACLVDDLGDAPNGPGLKIEPELLKRLDPAFSLLLAAGQRAFADGVTDGLDRDRVGVIIGNLALPSESSAALARQYLGKTLEEQVLDRPQAAGEPEVEPLNRYVAGLPAGVLAKAMGLGGGCYTLDAACASSLYAIKLAADELLSGRADAMLTGGLSRPDSLYTQMGFSQLRALSPTGTCAPFDRQGNGLVVGEGSGIFLLKRTADAVAAGDRIYGIVRGVGLSNDVGGSLLAPLSEGQLRAMRSAYRQAGWSPQDVDLIECHATGTPVGDAVEFSSLKTLWGEERWQRGQCTIGSVKSNIGHLLTAAGSAALTKVLLAMQEQTLPPTANFSQSSEQIDLTQGPFQVLQRATPWERRTPSTPRRAAVSAFGFGGINAHLLIEEWQGEATEVAATKDSGPATAKAEIAVVGLGASFGPWNSLETFEKRVLGQSPEVTPQKPENWWGAQSSAWFKEQGLNGSAPVGYLVDEVAVAAGRFRIPPKELEEMLPQQMLMLQVADAALADAKGNGAEGIDTGVFIGLGLDLNSTNFNIRWSLANKAGTWARQLGADLSAAELEKWTEQLRDSAGPALSANRTMGALGSIVASRIAREFQFGGPSFTLSSEESSGLRALETAVRALQQGDLNRALVGAIDLAGDLRSVLSQHAGRPYSPSGKARPFSTDADGAIIGEGAAAVVLKRLEDAERDGDTIYGVIKGIGTATGAGVDALMPDADTYLRSLQRAYEEAGVDPDSVAYLETHGSAVPAEDALEAQALTRFFGRRQSDLGCRLGSTKAQIGHAGAASGLASLVKTCLCLKAQMLPAMPNVTALRPELKKNAPMLKAGRERYWLNNRIDGPRRAGLSSFSVDGNCTHVVMEAWEKQQEPLPEIGSVQCETEALFALVGPDAAAIIEGLSQLEQHLQSPGQQTLSDLARQWVNLHPADSAERCALSLVATSRDELRQQIDFARQSLQQAPGKRLGDKEGAILPPFARDRVFYSPDPIGPAAKIAFVYPGSGNHFPGMGSDLARCWPQIFRCQRMDNDTLRSQYQADLFWEETAPEQINGDHRAMIFGQVALGTAFSDLVRAFGIEPQAVIGYSLGESTGLFSLGAWKNRDLMLKRMNDSTLFTDDLAGTCLAARQVWNLPEDKEVDWCLGVVDRPAAQVCKALKNRKKVYLLIVNTPGECVIGGDRQAVERLVAKLECNFFPIEGVTTVHCEVTGPVADPYRSLHLFDTDPPKGVTFYSGATGASYEVTRESAADAILAQAMEGIDYPKTIEAAYDDGARIFLEMGPGASCSRMIGQILEGRPHLARSASIPGQSSASTVLRLLAQLVAERVPVDLKALYGAAEVEADNVVGANRLLKIEVGGRPFAPPKPTADKAKVPDRPTTISQDKPMKTIPPAAPQRPQTIPAAATELQKAAAASGAPSALVAQMEETAAAKAQAHQTYLRLSGDLAQTMAANLAQQFEILQRMTGQEHAAFEFPAASSLPASPAAALPATDVAFDRDMCMEFAIGSLAKMLGPEFAEIDAYPTRVRLPDEPLMLVDRILSVEGEARSMTSGRVITEHDVLPGAWYLDGNRVPTCVAVEAGQADLFLSGYLGIDFITKGKAVYRLLDAVVTFHRGLPQPGETIHYDIRIEHFFRQDQTYLFRFNFEGTVNGEPLLSMKNGCAGFFTEGELAAGKGIVHTKFDLMPKQGVRPDDWQDLAPMACESYDDQQLAALRGGDLAACFGPLFAGLAVSAPYTLPDGRMNLVDRIVDLDPTGGRFGIGIIRGEMDIRPDDWFLTCHFVDDQVMPGTLMYECCMHTLRIYLLRMGWVGEEGETACEPIPGVDSQLKCRGQVTEHTRKVTYEITLKEIGYDPAPFVLCDALMYADDKPVVEIGNMSLRMTGLTRQKVESLWSAAAIPQQSPMQVAKEAIYDYDRINAFAVGKPSVAFGEPYRIFDEERRIARLPGPPFQFLDRITEIQAEPWKMQAGGVIEGQYDVPADAWYFAANRQQEMPFSVLLEIALQPCGWLAAYVGSALTSETDLCFRNLDGNAVQHRPITPDSGTLSIRVKLTRASSSVGMIIQNYDFSVSDAAGTLYEGDTVFGFFSKQALSQQVGIRDASPYSPTEQEVARGRTFAYPKQAPYPETRMRMIDDIALFVADGGPEGLGFIRGTKMVDPDEWFFKAHFYQDPVCPGSLGLESFLQLLKVVAVERWGEQAGARLETVTLGEKHSWNYRGQIIPDNDMVTVEAMVTAIDEERRLIRADGFLSVDGKIIYQMKDFTIACKGD